MPSEDVAATVLALRDRRQPYASQDPVYAFQEDPSVWADNETTNDLLGFDHLVDALELVLTDPKMLPVTVGVAGDWGSGKTSLMRMAQDRLSILEKVVTVSFSPWRFEGYDDMKAALMAAVIQAIPQHPR
jgi:hypothetical protein